MSRIEATFRALTVGFFLFSSPIHARVDGCAELTSRETSDRIQAAIEVERLKDKIPGIAYAAYTDKCLLSIGQVGSANAQGTETLDATKSLFRLASVSKLFTTIAISQLIERNLLTRESNLLDLDKVDFVRFLKRHESQSRLAQWAKIKIHHLMSHQSGISKDVPGALAFFNTESLRNHSYPTSYDFYRGLPSVEFLFPAGEVSTGIKYSNLGMNILARIVEAYNDERLSFPAYVAKYILAPLEMNNSFYDIPFSERAKMVSGYGDLMKNGTRTAVPKAYHVGSYDGSIGVASNARDLSRLGMEFLKIINQESTLIRDPEVIRDFFFMKARVNPTIGWASGPLWQVLPGETAANPLWTGHTGTGASERAIVLVSPERNLGINILFNTKDANREKYVKIIADILRTAKPGLGSLAASLVDSSRAFLLATPLPTPTTPKKHEPTSDLEKFVGTYFADIVGPKDVTLSQDGYLVFFGQKLAVENISQGKFRFPPIPGPDGILFNSEPLVFSFDGKGRPISIRAANVKKFTRVN